MRAGASVGSGEAARAYLTGDIPGIGGRVRDRPEDFLVDEIPAYQPSGEGEHLYLLVQKRLMSTLELVDVLARHFRVARRAIGYAGLKDKHALTRQVVSVHVPGRKLEDFPMLEHERVSILWGDMHANKLRPGHLKGNRFSIRIRGVRFQDVLVAERVVARLERSGVPNRVGEQRFGLLGNTHVLGRALLTKDSEVFLAELLGPNAGRPDLNAEGRRLFVEGRYGEAMEHFPRSATAERAVLLALARGRPRRHAMHAIDEAVRRFYVSAWQSWIFNRVLDERLARGDIDRLREGDLAFKHENGAVFRVDAGVAEDPGTASRLAGVEISASGPMWGPAMMRAMGEVDALEVRELEASGLGVEALAGLGSQDRSLLEGKRRPLRVPLVRPDVEGGSDEHGAFVRVAFELPRGAFATAVLPEIMKVEGVADAGGGDGGE